MSVRKISVDQASVFLQNLPEKPREDLSLREAVDRLQEQIRAALSKGYSYDDLSTMLSDKGVEISASTLKNYVLSGKREAAKQTPVAKTRTRRIRNQDGVLTSPPTKSAALQAVTEAVRTEAVQVEALPEADAVPASTRRRARSTTAAKETNGTKTKTSAATRSARAKSTIVPSPRRGHKKVTEA